MVSLPHWPTSPWFKRDKTDLKIFANLLKILGNPHLKIPPTIHIAGTNGKGSSCAYFKAIMLAANLKAHVYTSPHLVEYNERIVIAGERIADDFLFELIEIVRIACERNDIQPTFFEATTAIAFLAFSTIPADIVILETGIGGRLDPTNVVPSPLLSLITTISYDHINVLGANLSLIAGEKAGIIKANIPCVINFQADEVYQILLDRCFSLNSPAFCYEYDYGVTKIENGFLYSSREIEHEFLRPNLHGDHQLINAGGVIAAISLINKHFKITKDHITQGLKSAFWPARIEKINPAKYQHLVHSQTTSKVTIWLDGAHNSAGANALALWMKQYLTMPTYLILGMTKQRDVVEFCSYFKGLIVKGYGVQVLSEASSYSSAAIVQMARAANLDFNTANSIADALYQIGLNCKGECNVVICGSLFLAADFLKLIT